MKKAILLLNLLLLTAVGSIKCQINFCTPVTHLRVDRVTASGALISWHNSPSSSYNGAHIEWRQAGDPFWQMENTNDSIFAIIGLNSGNLYQVRVASICDGGGLSDFDTVDFATHILACALYDTNQAQSYTITGGNVSNISSGLPIMTNRRFSFSEQLVTADEIPDTGDLHALSFFFTSSVITQRRSCAIYLATTTLDSICDTQFVHPDLMTKVYEGPLNLSPGWDTIEFNLARFHYSGNANLLVAVADNSDTDFIGGFTFRTHQAPKKSIIFWSMTPGNNNLASMHYFGNSLSRNDMQLHFASCLYESPCHAPEAFVSLVSSDSVVVRWTSGASEEFWHLYAKADTADFEYYGTAYDNFFTFSNLERGLRYTFRIVGNCQDSLYAEVVAYTTCLPLELPLIEDFEQWPTGSDSPVMPCWYFYGSYSNNTPYVANWASHSGNNSIFMQSTTATTSIVVLPVIEPTFDIVQFNCWIKKRQDYGDYTILVGAIPDSLFANPSLDSLAAAFLPMDSISVTSSEWQFVELPFYETTVYEGHLALLSPQGYVCNTLIDDISLIYAPSCPHPDSIVFDRCTSDSLFVHWNSKPRAQGWIVSCGDQQFFTYDTSAAFGQLSIQTAYDITLRAWCDEGDTSEAISARYSTSCGKISSLPYSTDFDGVENAGLYSANFAECWSRHINYDSPYLNIPFIGNQQNDNIFNQQGIAHSGNQYMRFYVASDINGTPGLCQWATLPEIDTTALPINTLMLKFWALNLQQSNSTQELVIGVMSHPDSIETFVPVDTINVTHSNGNSNYSFYEVLFNRFSGSGSYIALRADRTYWTYNILIDDLDLVTIPTCPHVTEVTNPFADHDHLTLNWTEMGNATSWSVEYGPHGFAEGSGTVDTAYALPFTVSGLQSETSYDFIIHPICSDSSQAVRATFSTTVFYNSLPFHEDFSNGSAYNQWSFHQRRSGSGIGYTDPVINSWAIGNAVGCGDSSSLFITLDSGSTFDYYPDRDAICFAWTDIMLPDSGNYDYSFDYRCSNGDPNADLFHVALVPASVNITSLNHLGNYIYIDGGNGYTSLASNDWSNYSGTLLISPNITGRHPGVYHLVFFWRNDGAKYDGSSSYGGLPAAIDNIQFTQQHCATASSINMLYVGSDSLRFSWSLSSGISGSSWIVECGNNTTVVTGSPYIYAIGGLTPSTTYAIHVTRLCDDGDTSLSRTLYQSTLCAPTTLPFYEDFDNVTTITSDMEGLMPNCWRYSLNTTGNNSFLPGICYGTTNSHSGNYSLMMRMNGQVILPEIATSLDSVRLNFWHYGTQVTVGVMEGNNFVPIQTCHCLNYAYTYNTVTFESYTGSSRIIAFRNHTVNNYGAQNWLDDISIEYVSFCHPATNIHATAAHNGNITVNWDSEANASQWQLEYGPVGFTPGNGITMYPISHPTSILMPEGLSTVDIYVRPICGTGDTGYWAGPAPISAPLCNNPTEVYTGYSADTSAKHPISLNHKYSLVETIITADELQLSLDNTEADTNGITSIAFFYRGTTPISNKDSVDIYLQPFSLSAFSWSQWPVNTSGQLVYSGSLNCSHGWNYFQLIQPYFWDGTSNLLVVIDDHSGQTDTSNGSFGVAISSDMMTVGAYANNTPFNPYNPARSDVLPEPIRLRPMLKLVSCQPHCPEPYNVTVTDTTENTATLSWQGDEGTYQVQIVTYIDSMPHSTVIDTIITISDTNGSFVANNLIPTWNYLYNIRTICDTDFLSDWISGLFTTTATPCLPPTDLTVIAQHWDGATLQWSPGISEQQWQLHVWNTSFDTIITTSSNTTIVSHLIQSIDYNAAVRALCDQWGASSLWSDTITLTAAECPVPNNLHVTESYPTHVTIAWNATTDSYDIEYGAPNFPQGSGMSITNHHDNSVELQDLNPNSVYDFFVRSRCGDSHGLWSERLRFSTSNIGIDRPQSDQQIEIVPNPAKNSTTLTFNINSSSDITVKLVDISGRIVSQTTLPGNTTRHHLNLSQFPAGSYFIAISTANSKIVRKLIVID